MAKRQHCHPLIIQDGNVERLHHVPFQEHQIDEGQLQKMLFEHPQILPAAEIEPVFNNLLAVCCELPTRVGPIDLLLMTPEGCLVIVETKLWRNPESKRSVVAQIIDYAKEMAGWSYRDVVDAVRRSSIKAPGIEGSKDPLAFLARQASDDFDEVGFVDTVSRTLKLGRELLLIVGDGIRDDVEHMAEYLQRTPQLGFTLGLVEIGLYRTQSRPDAPLLVCPRVVARTCEVTRAVVEIRNLATTVSVDVSVPTMSEMSPPRAAAITEEVYYRELERKTSPEVVKFVKRMVDAAASHRLRPEWQSASMTLKYEHKDNGALFSFGSLKKDGVAWVGWLRGQCKRAGVPESVALDYLNAIASRIPTGVVNESDEVRIGNGKHYPSIQSLMAIESEWLLAIDAAIRRIDESLAE